MRDRNPKHLPFRGKRRERRVGLFDAYADVLAAKLQITISQHRAWEQPRLAKNLESVADAEHRPAGRGELANSSHDRREPRDRSCAQVIAVRKPARQHDDVGAIQPRFLVPEELGVLTKDVL